ISTAMSTTTATSTNVPIIPGLASQLSVLGFGTGCATAGTAASTAIAPIKKLLALMFKILRPFYPFLLKKNGLAFQDRHTVVNIFRQFGDCRARQHIA